MVAGGAGDIRQGGNALKVKRLSLLVLLAAVAGLAVAAAAAVADGDQVQPIDITHNFSDAPAPVSSAQWANGPNVKTGSVICSTPTTTAANVNTDCEFNGPHNETAIAVNPTDPSNIVGGANDYQLSVNPGGHVGEQVASRAHVSFDGGRTWSEYPIYSNSAYQGTGDPSIAFDADGRAYFATLGFRFVGPVNATNPDVLVGTSVDKGRTWAMQRVASGSGTETGVGDLLDKEWVTAWGHGNALVTFGDFRLGHKGETLSGNIYDVVTHDGGRTWSQPTQVSFLNNSFGSVPTFAGGRVFVSFLDTSHHLSSQTAADFGRDDYLVQEVSPASGAPIGNPYDVGTVYDGNYDYPWQLGRTTYQDSAFRTWAFGNITADPNHPDHLALTWSDMRNSPGIPYPPFADSYKVQTDSDVVVSESWNGGASWSTPTALAIPGDQFMPWGAFDSSGKLRVGYFDRSVDPANHAYGYSVATVTGPGTFSSTTVSTANSDPTRDSRFFARTIDSAFPNATGFLGDYSTIAADPSTGGVIAYWTDMRNVNCFAAPSNCGLHGEDAYFGRAQ